MKRTGLFLIFAVAATSASAGNLSDPVVEPEVVIADTVANAKNDNWVGAALTFIVFAIALGAQ